VHEHGDDVPVDACLTIAQALPDYFTVDAVRQMRRDLATATVFVSADGREVVGFAVVQRKSPAVAELLWIAVERAHQGQGYGAQLLAAIVARLHSDGALLLEVKTLDRAAAYPPYEGTRRFYERAGFLHLETVDPYPGWEPGTPCAIYVRMLP
jgi:GNAT superfamily N-acetyltransferase